MRALLLLLLFNQGQFVGFNGQTSGCVNVKCIQHEVKILAFHNINHSLSMGFISLHVVEQ